MLHDVRLEVDELSKSLILDELWVLAEPLFPEFIARPQGGGTGPVDERAVFIVVVFVLTSTARGGCCLHRSGSPFRPCICSTEPSCTDGGRPGRGSSASPGRPCSMNRFRHFATVIGVTPTGAARCAFAPAPRTPTRSGTATHTPVSISLPAHPEMLSRLVAKAARSSRTNPESGTATVTAARSDATPNDE